MCSTPPRNISNVQHTTSKYFKCAARHLKIFQVCSILPRNTFRCAAHHLEKYFKCVAHHLEIFQTRRSPPRNIMRSDKTACTEGSRPCGFLGGGFELTRTFSLYRYKGPRALTLPGSVSLPWHLSRVYGFLTGWPSNRVHPCHKTLIAALAEPRPVAGLIGMAVQQPRTVCDTAAVVYTGSECCSVIPGLLITLWLKC